MNTGRARYASVTIVTPPATEPVSLTEAKAQCRVTGTADDALLGELITAARNYIENVTGRALVEQTLKLTTDAFMPSLELPRGPVTSVSSVQYYDTAGDLQTVSSSGYTVDLVSDPQWVVINTDAAWPDTIDRINAVIVNYVAGYSTLPTQIKQAALLLISQWYDNREGMNTMPVMTLLEPYRAGWVGA